MSEFISIKEASRLTGLHENTLRRLGDEQKISCYKTPSGQRRFNKHYLEKMCNPIFINKESTKTNFIYTRVSSKKQLDDLTLLDQVSLKLTVPFVIFHILAHS